VPDVEDLDFLLFRQEAVLATWQAMRYFTPSAIRHRLASKRWQRVHRGVFVTRLGPLSREQRKWIGLLAAGDGRQALLGGLAALEAFGFHGFARDTVDVVVPAAQRPRLLPVYVRVHRTKRLSAGDVRDLADPPSTMPARSVVDAARWASSDREARAIIAAAFQQRLVAGDDVHQVLRRLTPVKRGRLIATTAADASGGAHSLAELDFLALSRRAGFPEPRLQVVRRDARGRKRYLDLLYEEYGVHVEIDGGQHLDVRQAWADMQRQNDLWIAGGRVLRFPAWLVRERPDEVVAQVRAALVAAGWRPRVDRGRLLSPQRH
jgi:hypothetical protein